MYEFIIFIPLSIIMSPSSTMFFLTLSQASIFHELLTTHSYQLSADFYVNCSILCNIEYHFQRWCPYTCAMSQRLLFQALALFSDSFNEVYSTPFLLVTTLTVSSCYFISLSLKKVTKVCLVCIYSCILSSLKIHRHLNRSTFTLLTFLISVFTLCKMCFRMIVFTLFVYKVSLKYYRLFYNTQHGSLS